ncbi:hypothetical protein WME75_09635 [Sorangium sp. So ce1014]
MQESATMRVAILDDYQGVALRMADWQSLHPAAEVQAFADHLDDLDALAERLGPFDGAVLLRERTPFPRALLERLPRLRLLVTAGMRNASIDLAAATARGVQVSGTDMLPYPTAELTWGLILALVRHIPREDRVAREGRWQTTLGLGLKGKTPRAAPSWTRRRSSPPCASGASPARGSTSSSPSRCPRIIRCSPSTTR